MFRSSLLLLFLFSVNAFSSEVAIKLVGNKIVWSDSIVSGDTIKQSSWSNTSRFNMLPVKAWAPAFVKNTISELVFKNTVTGEQVLVNFEHTKLNFRYSNSGTSVNDLGVGNCSRTDVSAGIISLENNTGGSCLARSYISSDRPIVEAFEFYNSDFRFDNLVSAFKDAHVSKGKYIALYRYTLGYASILDNGVYTYNYYEADPVSFIVDYQPAYIDSIVVEGDGVFDLDYDKNSHTVKGRTKYSVFVDGYLDPGVLLTLRSSGLDTKNFYLKNGDGTHQIPYSVYCTLCEERVVVQNGLLLKEDKSRIEYTGSNLNFNLNFKFDEQKIIEPGITESGTIVEGDYSDTVALLLELDL